MTPGDARDRFAALCARPDGVIDLLEAALCVAGEEYPGLDVDAYLARFERLARAAGARLAGAESTPERVDRLNRFLFEEEGFAGNREQYEDPRNSFLNDVLDRKTGIPITLSLVYMEVGRRIGLDVRGIGFPGHFLVKSVGAPEIVIDAFHGRVLSLDDCQALLIGILGRHVALEPGVHLRAATPREILVRLLSNLKRIYLRREDLGRALACCDRILLLAPDAPLEVRDRGMIYEQLDCFSAALLDLQRYLDLAPDDGMAPAVRERLAALRLKAARLH
jgi:regulator of sirC expression with transglutaminase-like and TPR domain